MFRGKFHRIHFVGIGGIGMSGIAEVLLTLGFTVSGSDLREGPAVARLRSLGARVQIGHRPENVEGVDVVVRSTAVDTENPEVREAQSRMIPVIRRAEMLAELMRLKYGIAVAGSHGKTTTTSMLAAIMRGAKLDPTVVIGGRLACLGNTNALLGRGDYLLAEADESDGSFLYLHPTVAMVTNIDPEHLDHYGTMEALEATFMEFVNRVPFYGFSVLCLDHPVVQRLLPQVRRQVVTYGFARRGDYRASQVVQDGLHTTFKVHRGEEWLGDITLKMPGVHNVSNAVGAVATALEMDIPFAVIQEALFEFTGVERRFTVVAEVGGVLLVDDYGHHPVEIEATLKGAEEAFPDRRILAVFQPHRYSRVEALWDEFLHAFHHADQVWVCPIYPAGEAPREGIDHGRLAAGILERGHRGTAVVESLEELKTRLLAELRPGDVVITLGAGNVNSVLGELAAELERR
ncbi:MAG: UDP-N-acetylmuramate--L-alanine ligase [Deltaproteobacteria bacterium]|nr:UDP-N-acetylmuramate--L-alanine ligase [Deltaproteobacteria bacterium]